MKKFSVLAAFIFAVMISSTAFAANWVTVDSEQRISVDSNSIKRGIHSNVYNVSTNDGFSVHVRWDYRDGSGTVYLVGFNEEKGKWMFSWLERVAQWDKNGKSLTDNDHSLTYWKDVVRGNEWPAKVFNYAKNRVR